MNAVYEQAISGLIESGFAIIENFIDEEITNGLRKNLHLQYVQGEFKKAGIGKWNTFHKNKEVRSDHIYWIDKLSDNDTEITFFSLVNDFMQYLNRTCFTSLKSFEFHYALYPKQAFYKRHLDQFLLDDSRQYTMIFYLNENWCVHDGGQLVLYLEKETLEIIPKGGTMVFFESQKIEHEVLPSNRDRMSVTGWLKNSELKVIL